MSLHEAALEIAQFLESQNIPYVILGGLAVQHWGEPRTTRDVDVMVLILPAELEAIIKKILRKFNPRITNALSFALQHRVLLVNTLNGIPIDISLGIPGYEDEVIRRAIDISLPGSSKVRMISSEDLIIHKCVAGRARDREDIERVLIRQRLAVDLDYIRRWLQDFAPLVNTSDVCAIFEEALQRARHALAGDRQK
jgi:predicted nucleotidyltransferase